MADAIQVKRRRGTNTQCDSMTPAEGEIIVDLTSDELRLGDGVNAGGIIIPNIVSSRTNRYSRGTIGGTGDAITLVMAPVQASYPTGLNVKFFAGAANTGAVTLAIDGMAAKAIVKVEAGALVPLIAGDLTAGGSYEIDYDGAQFVLSNPNLGGLISVSQGDLNTLTGSGSLGGFGDSWKVDVTHYSGIGSNLSTSAVSRIGLRVNNGGSADNTATQVLSGGEYGFIPRIYKTGSTSSRAVTFIQRYISSSPPFDLGDGEVGGFIFVLVNAAGEIVQYSAADVPPWAYNGPTRITADYKDGSGKKFTRQNIVPSYEEFMDNRNAKIKSVAVEITHALKNADMALIPHPFGEVPEGHTVVLLDPMSDMVHRTLEYQNKVGIDWAESITDGKMLVDFEAKCKRCGPCGVQVHKMKYKYTKRI